MTLARGWECDRLLARWRTQRSMAETSSDLSRVLKPAMLKVQTKVRQKQLIHEWRDGCLHGTRSSGTHPPKTKTSTKKPSCSEKSFLIVVKNRLNWQIPWTTMTNIKSKFLQLSGASHKWAPSISPVTHTHWAGKCKSLSGTDTHLTPRGNLNISCSLSSSSLLAVPLSCPHHWPAVYKQFAPLSPTPSLPSIRSSAGLSSLCLICLITVFRCYGNLHADVCCTQPRATTTTHNRKPKHTMSWKGNLFGSRNVKSRIFYHQMF